MCHGLSGVGGPLAWTTEAISLASGSDRAAAACRAAQGDWISNQCMAPEVVAKGIALWILPYG
eukprot:4900786-Alexandrium_andersonii.AAC.1